MLKPAYAIKFSWVLVVICVSVASAQQLTIFPDNSIFTPYAGPQAVNEGSDVAIGQHYRATSKASYDEAGFNGSGLVEVYDSTGNHSLTIPNPDPTNFDGFGSSLAINGDLIFVTSRYSTTDEGVEVGAVYAFDMSALEPTVPAFEFRFPGPANSFDDAAVDVDENIVVVGVPRFANFDNGRVFLFDLSSQTPEAPFLELENPASQDNNFGISVQVSGRKIAVGTDNDRALVYDLDAPSPTVPQFNIGSPEVSFFLNMNFARTLAFDGDWLVVADSGFGDYDEFFGKVYVYNLAQPNPKVPFATLTDPEPATYYRRFGVSMSIDGDHVLVGASEGNGVPLYDLSGATPGAHVVLYNKPADTTEQAFSSAVDLWIDRALIGAPLDRRDGHFGAAFEYSGNNPDVLLTLNQLSPLSSEDLFGTWTDMNDDYIFVADDPDTFPTESRPPRIYAFSRDSGDFSEPEFVITNSNVRFGSNFLLAENFIFVASWFGDVYAYDLASADPTSVAYLFDNPDGNREFGIGMGYDNGILAIGDRGPSFGNPGRIYLYDLNSGTPTKVMRSYPGVGSSTGFGRTVAIHKNLLVGGTSDGPAFVYDINLPDRPRNELIRVGPFNGFFGRALTIFGTTVIVAAPNQDLNGQNNNAGEVYIYDLANVDLTTANLIPHTLAISNPHPTNNADFGSKLELLGNSLLVAAPEDSFDLEEAGAAFLFDIKSDDPGMPTEVFRNPTPNTEDFFANSIGLAFDGIAIGAPQVDDRSPDSGAAFVYNYSAGNFLQSLDVTSGVTKFQDLNSLRQSDDQDLSIKRNPAQIRAKIEFTAKGYSSVADPERFEFLIESSVFARPTIILSVDLFNFEIGEYELASSGPASRFDDGIVHIQSTGDLARFVESGSGCVLARIRYQSPIDRTSFAANIDQIRWIVE